MPLVAVPNVSEGRDPRRIEAFGTAITSAGARVLDIHSDPTHHRSVFTATGDFDALLGGIVALSEACRAIDLTRHDGAHPRLGGLDVCPFVPFEEDMTAAIAAAHTAAARIGDQGIPVFLYGAASERPETAELPGIRKGGLEALTRRMGQGLHPDHGPGEIDPRVGVVCVGARGPLIAFNVVLDAPRDAAKEIVGRIRDPSAVRALALELPIGVQVSMNLIDPARFGIDDAFAAVVDAAAGLG
ncbi:MAG: glutamate formiminotransferase, partial [Actinomycetota bacterium]|nr:glutamate formiminotransferase [Actinomycetota bacterium]